MQKILLLYPDLFKSYTKFDRKLSKILSKTKDFKFICKDDPNNFIDKYIKEYSLSSSFDTYDKLEELDVTHAIVFDDGEEFKEEVLFLKKKEIKIRIIKILITRVINIRKDVEYSNLESNSKYEYIGRGSYWGNPHSMYEAGEDRDEVIRLFKYDFDNDNFPRKRKSEVHHLAAKRLGCFCKPLYCHGDILADYLNSFDDEK